MPSFSVGQRSLPIAQKSLAFGSIGASYSVVGSIFSTAMSVVIIVSTLDEAVQFSWDGVTDAFPIPAGATLIIDFVSDELLLAGSYGPYVKQLGVPTSGSLYVGGFTV